MNDRLKNIALVMVIIAFVKYLDLVNIALALLTNH